MAEPMNRCVLLGRRPSGAVTEDCFEIVDRELPALGDGDVLVRNIYLSCDPYMRGQMGGGAGYKVPFELEEVVPARVVGQVHESRNPGFAVGEFVWAFLGWELFTLSPNGVNLRKVDPALGPISHAISVLGMPGLTAWVGMDLCAPRAGETAYVSAATGAVGQVAGQLAKAAGARIVGSAGTDRKVSFLVDELGFDAAFNYRTAGSIEAALGAQCPDGVDCYFDNVGGETLDAVLALVNDKARIAVCGQISQYDDEVGGYAIRNIRAILGKRATMTGFSVRDNMHRFDAVVPELANQMKVGKLRYREDIFEGIDRTPAAFVGMMSGENIGKRLVKVGDDPTL